MDNFWTMLQIKSVNIVRNKRLLDNVAKGISKQSSVEVQWE